MGKRSSGASCPSLLCLWDELDPGPGQAGPAARTSGLCRRYRAGLFQQGLTSAIWQGWGVSRSCPGFVSEYPGGFLLPLPLGEPIHGPSPV